MKRLFNINGTLVVATNLQEALTLVALQTVKA